MSGLITYNFNRTSAKPKPECISDHILWSPAVFLAVLEPVYNPVNEIVDFVVILASASLEELEGGEPLTGKRIRSQLPSAPQWFEKAIEAMEHGNASQVITAGGEKKHTFHAFFSRQNNRIISNWHYLGGYQDPEKRNREEESLLIRNIIHEIRNPLTAIELANQLLMDENRDETGSDLSLKTLTRIIFQNSKKIEAYLRQLLIPKNTEEEQLTNIDVGEVLDLALQKAENRLFLDNVKLKRAIRHGCVMPGIPDKLCTAFLNIIINAVEAMPTGAGRLYVAAIQVPGFTRITIRDNGTGMSKEVMEKIFDPYYTSKKDGLGIGLANVKAILTSHGAKIDVKSQEGRGTSFVIHFPQAYVSKIENHPVQSRMDF